MVLECVIYFTSFWKPCTCSWVWETETCESAVASKGSTVARQRCLWLFLCDCFSFAGWSFSMGSAYQFHSWRVFVVVCALPCVSAVVALTFMPESPRFYLEVREKRRIAAPFSVLMTLEMTLKGFQRTAVRPRFLLGFRCKYVRCRGVNPRFHQHFPGQVVILGRICYPLHETHHLPEGEARTCIESAVFFIWLTLP